MNLWIYEYHQRNASGKREIIIRPHSSARNEQPKGRAPTKLTLAQSSNHFIRLGAPDFVTQTREDCSRRLVKASGGCMLEKVQISLRSSRGVGAVTGIWGSDRERYTVGSRVYLACSSMMIIAGLHRSCMSSGTVPPHALLSSLCSAMLPLHRYLIDSAFMSCIAPELTP
jgi:hypothetical protein